MRTFIAVPLSPDCHRMLEELQKKLRATGAEARWVAVSSIHLTLKFLGEIDPAETTKLRDALRAASDAESGFMLCLRGLGAFPDLRNPRVVWCGVEGDIERLRQLQVKVEQACSSLGYALEDRAFHPHLTLGRLQGKRNLQRLLEYIKIGSDLESVFAVDRYGVYQSTLTPRGATYHILETFRLRTDEA